MLNLNASTNGSGKSQLQFNPKKKVLSMDNIVVVKTDNFLFFFMKVIIPKELNHEA